jgi:hypothetical protein
MVIIPSSSASFLVALQDDSGHWHDTPAEQISDAEIREIHKASKWLRTFTLAGCLATSTDLDVAGQAIRVSWLWDHEREAAQAKLDSKRPTEGAFIGQRHRLAIMRALRHA